jgi:signal transduction histidine kinase
MKLLVKNFYILLIFSLFTFLVGGIILYFNLKSQIYHEMDQSLILEKDRIIQKLMVSDTIPNFYTNFENQIKVEDKEDILPPQQKISDTIIYDSIENDYIPFRKLESVISLYTRIYKIDVAKSLINKTDLIRDIFMLMLFLFFSLLGVLLFVNLFISRKLLKPFYTTLGIIKNYQVTKSPGLKLPETNTKEFTMLNEVLNIMSDKIYSDFLTLKEFTENASHEMQTPLSIIRAKLELLIQDETLSREQLKLIQSINDSNNRLSKMSRALVLITRIESLQFNEKSTININQTLDNLLRNFNELISEKGIVVTKVYQEELIVDMNTMLADTLLNNLISNAIRHNIVKGNINIKTTKSEISISNSGLPLISNPDILFQRFSKDKPQSDSLGLGLAIVKKIADTNDIQITYTYNEGQHTLTLYFNSSAHSIAGI